MMDNGFEDLEDFGLILEEGKITPDQLDFIKKQMGIRFVPFCELVFTLTDDIMAAAPEDQAEVIRAFKLAVSH